MKQKVRPEWMTKHAEEYEKDLPFVLESLCDQFERTGDTIYIWHAVQGCDWVKRPLPEWVTNYFIVQTLNGEGVKFDGRSIKRENARIMNKLFYELIETRRRERDISLTDATYSVSEDVGLSYDRVKNIHEKVRSFENKVNKEIGILIDGIRSSKSAEMKSTTEE